MKKLTKETILLLIIASLFFLFIGIGIGHSIGLKLKKTMTTTLIINEEVKEYSVGEMLGGLSKNDQIIFNAIGVKNGEKTLKQLIEEINKKL